MGMVILITLQGTFPGLAHVDYLAPSRRPLICGRRSELSLAREYLTDSALENCVPNSCMHSVIPKQNDSYGS